MTLATRCTSCGTAFRVVQDQLKISDGWVRCGRCGAVFNATESLFDLDALTPPGPTPPLAPSSPAAAPPTSSPPSTIVAAMAASAAARGDMAPSGDAWSAAPPAAHTEPGADPATAAPDLSGLPCHEPWPVPSPERADHGDQAEPGADALAVPDPAHTEPSDHPGGADTAPARDAEAARADAIDAADVAARADAATDAATSAPAAPHFVRKAERAARWQSREARVALATAALLLAGAAAMQAARGFHASIAAQWPQSRSWLDPLCEWAGCESQPRRRLEALTVESSSLVTVAGTDWTRLTVVLRNRDRTRVRLPAVELTLTDAQGTIVARKVLTMAELGTDQSAIDPGSELALQAVLDPGGRRIVGYTIELFYP